MVAQYTIFGRQVGSHVLAMTTLGVTFGGAYLATRGGGKKTKEQGPLINASTKEEETFIQEFIRSANAEEEKKKSKQ